MEPVDRELHPIYGAVPSDGEFVQQGEILGLSADASELVFAPISGWVELVPLADPADRRLTVRIQACQGESAAPAP